MKTCVKQLIFVILFNLMIISQIHANESPNGSYIKMAWEQKAAGVWSCSIGQPEKYDLLKAAGIKPRIDALNQKS